MVRLINRKGRKAGRIALCLCLMALLVCGSFPAYARAAEQSNEHFTVSFNINSAPWGSDSISNWSGCVTSDYPVYAFTGGNWSNSSGSLYMYSYNFEGQRVNCVSSDWRDKVIASDGTVTREIASESIPTCFKPMASLDDVWITCPVFDSEQSVLDYISTGDKSGMLRDGFRDAAVSGSFSLGGFVCGGGFRFSWNGLVGAGGSASVSVTSKDFVDVFVGYASVNTGAHLEEKALQSIYPAVQVLVSSNLLSLNKSSLVTDSSRYVEYIRLVPYHYQTDDSLGTVLIRGLPRSAYFDKDGSYTGGFAPGADVSGGDVSGGDDPDVPQLLPDDENAGFFQRILTFLHNLYAATIGLPASIVQSIIDKGLFETLSPENMVKVLKENPLGRAILSIVEIPALIVESIKEDGFFQALLPENLVETLRKSAFGRLIADISAAIVEIPVRFIDKVKEDGFFQALLPSNMVDVLSSSKLGKAILSLVEFPAKVGKVIIEGFKETLKDLFVPDADRFNKRFAVLRERFAFVDSFMGVVDDLFDSLQSASGASAPVIKIDLSRYAGRWSYGNSVVTIDFSWYAPYKGTVDALLAGIIWVNFIWRMYKRLPELIRGAGMVTDQVSDLMPVNTKPPAPDEASLYFASLEAEARAEVKARNDLEQDRRWLSRNGFL